MLFESGQLAMSVPEGIAEVVLLAIAPFVVESVGVVEVDVCKVVDMLCEEDFSGEEDLVGEEDTSEEDVSAEVFVL